jgi:hypothetical protein
MGGTAEGTPASDRARSSFEPHRGETPRDALRSKATPGTPAGRHFESEPARAGAGVEALGGEEMATASQEELT